MKELQKISRAQINKIIELEHFIIFVPFFKKNKDKRKLCLLDLRNSVLYEHPEFVRPWCEWQKEAEGRNAP